MRVNNVPKRLILIHREDAKTAKSFPRTRESTEEIMSKISRICLLILIAFCLAPVVHGEETSTRKYELPAYGLLELDVPKSWKDKVLQSPGNLPPTISMEPGAGDDFAVMVTPFWNLAGIENFNSDERIKEGLEQEKQKIVPTAVEEELVMHRIEGPGTYGYYFMATDKAPKPGEWEHLVLAAVGAGDLLVSVTVLSHSKESVAVNNALTMIRNIRQRKFAPPNHEQKMWALATCAVLTERNRGRHDLLGGCERTERNIEAWQGSLREWWGIEGRADLFETLFWLQSGGHRRQFDGLGKHITSLSPDELAAFKEEVSGDVEKSNNIDVVMKHYAECGEKSILGWDYVRYVSLCGWGYVVSYLSEDEAWERIMPVARQLQGKFDSWEDLGKNYMIGRQYWSAIQTTEQGDLFNEAFDTLHTSPSSPWKKISWDLDLTPTYADKREEK